MVSWVAQDSEGLLDVDQPAVWLIGALAVALSVGAVITAVRTPWPNGSMKLAPSFAKIMFVIILGLTATWIMIGIAFTDTPTAQALYGTCALLSGWSAWAMFVTLRDVETA
jgi:ABC-type Na+ efflux pump permease subunit